MVTLCTTLLTPEVCHSYHTVCLFFSCVGNIVAVFLYKTSQICPTNKLAMFLMTKELDMSINTNRSCTLPAIPTVPSALSSGRVVVFIVSVPTHVTRCPVIATKQLWHVDPCWYSGSYLQFLCGWSTSWYYVEGRKCCGRNRIILVAAHSVITGCTSFTANTMFTRNRTAVLSYWPDYRLVVGAGMKRQAVKLACTAHAPRIFFCPFNP